MALTKKTTRADKVAAAPKKNISDPTGVDSWKLPTPGAFGRDGSQNPIENKWIELGKKIQSGARLRPRTNSERYTGKRVQYTNPKSAKSGPKGAPISEKPINTPSGKIRKK